MATQAPPVRDERDGLRAYLLQQQDAFRVVVTGLDAAAMGVAAAGRSSLTLGALLKHVTATQQSWLAQALAAAGTRHDDRTPEQRQAEHTSSWSWTAEDTVAAALADFDAVCAAVLDAVTTLNLETAVPPAPAPWNPTDVVWSVRWVWLHLLEELARHAGHADLVRENLDGATMYELLAAHEGWPATDWLTPWAPQRAQAPYGWGRRPSPGAADRGSGDLGV
ncbi:mycothiol transferase [Nocardioides sp. AX2bis]|uniref:mycothiol transferase n=1 Tax=Nocardioides sp. AX2bis TaxID=2653157 RepID=UPI0012F1C0AD|nr:DUF664 domain-containing protein [Nocardioides sp. AX2bis]VXB21613.1 conserved hypothetical protein [Nocardioides sp. AX2bis]